MLYGRLTVLEEVAPQRDKKGRKYRVLKCLCECGGEKVIRRNAVLRGNTKSCGCIRKELVSNLNKKHGMRHHRIYYVFNDMMQRCYNQNNFQYKNYGGRGIMICNRWKNSINNFIEDMESSFKEGLQIDRINNNKDYSPRNCKWSTPKENTNNRRCTIKYRDKTATTASLELGLGPNAIWSRIKSGWSVKKAFTTPRLR